MSCTETAEPIDLPFGFWTQVGRRKREFNRIRQMVPMCTIPSYSPGGLDVFHGTLPRAVQKRLNRSFAIWVVDLGGPKEAQVQSYSPGGANVPSWGHIGATLRIRLNRPSATAMRSSVKLETISIAEPLQNRQHAQNP